jgi:hypothetical protein
MNKDSSLKSTEQKIVFLVVGNNNTGKKSIANAWMNLSKSAEFTQENRTFYNIYSFLLEDVIDNENLSNIVEIRVMNGDEIDTDLKVNATFYKGALGAFVVTKDIDYLSFQE